MKILITSEWYPPMINGVAVSVANLQRELQDRGHDVKVLTLATGFSSIHQDDVTLLASMDAGIFYPGARFTMPIYNRSLRKLVRWQPDIIHSQCEFSTFHIARLLAKKMDIPFVHTYHTVYEDYTHYFAPNKKLGKVIASYLSKKLLSYTDYVIAPTNKVRSLLVSYGVDKPIQVIPTGIDFRHLIRPISTEEIHHLRKKVGIPEDKKVLVYIGRLAKEKNLEELFLYLAKLKDDRIRLLVVGDGPQRETLERYASRLAITDLVVFAGMVSPQGVSHYYQLGDVFVNASTSETQGLTYIEALANGVPALCRKDHSLESVIFNGINGWQYDNFEDFQEKCNLILFQEGLREKLSDQARKMAATEYSSEKFASRVEQVYLEATDAYHGYDQSLYNYSRAE